jgi:lipoprotein-releasing system ATP-binding protein
MSEWVLQCQDIDKSFNDGGRQIQVLNGINVNLCQGQTLAITGASGSGKSTLLQIMGGLDQPDAGEVILAGQSMAGLSARMIAALRNRALGFVFQFHHLLAEFTALENVMIPLLIGHQSPSQSRQKATTMLQQVGLGSRLDHRPAALSGGERQRVAIARSLVNQPQCVLMDEPTGNLDIHTAAQIMTLFRHLSQALGIAMVVVTHDLVLAKSMQQQLNMQGGNLDQP